MMARLERGDVLLTTRMSDVFQSLDHAVLARDTALRQGHPKGVLIQSRHLRGLSKGKPAIGVKATGQFDLHVTLPFAGSEGQTGEGLVVEIESDAHADSIVLVNGRVKLPLWLPPSHHHPKYSANARSQSPRKLETAGLRS